MGFDREFRRKLAQRGWVGLTLPKEYGGGGRSHFARFVLIEELLAAAGLRGDAEGLAGTWDALAARYGIDPGAGGPSP